MDEVRIMLSELKSGIQLIAFTETWVNNDIHDAELHIPGYNLFRKDRVSRGGGIAVYVRCNITAFRREDLEDANVEGLWLEISLPKSRGFLVGAFYRPPNSSNYYDKDFMTKLDRTLDLATALGKEFLLQAT